MKRKLQTTMNTKHFSLLFATVALCSPLAAHAQTPKAKPAIKPVPAKTAPAKPTGPVVLGTTQLPGDFGKIGTTYTIGTRDPINFTLRSVEYSVERFVVGSNTYVPRANQKVMLLHYTVHNPNPRELSYYGSAIRFTAVDARDENQQAVDVVVREGENEPLSMNLKPAQKIDVVAAIMVPAKGPVPKLIVERERNAPVIRYDLRGKATGLKAPYADPADQSGETALEEVIVPAGATVALNAFDIRLEQVTALEHKKLSRKELPKGKQFVAATFTLKNRTARNERYYWADFKPEVTTASGEAIPYNQELLYSDRDETAFGELRPGQEIRLRFFAAVPVGATGLKMRMVETRTVRADQARAFVFDLSGAGVNAPVAAAQ
jgi:hypothetical protein